MEIINPVNRNNDDVSKNNCACMCDTNSAYWDVKGVVLAERCGCQCKEGNIVTASANYSTALAHRP